DGRKVKQVSGGYPLFYLWSSVLGEPVVELDGSGGVYRAYVLSSGGQMIAVQSYDGGFYWLHTDHLGNGRKLTNSSGTVVYRAEFDPHGQMLYEWQSSGQTYLNSHKFTGYERDWATNLNYAKARTYNHNRARFMQPDPLGLAAADLADPQSLNRYSYVGNDPANFVDPSGLLRIIIWGVACVESGGTRTCEYYVQEIIDFGGGFGLLGWGYGGSGQGGDVKPISPIPLKDIVDEAKQALKDPNGDCAKLFNKGNGSSKLGELDKANKIKLGNAKVTTSNGQTMEMKTHNGFAGLYQGGQITISQYSSYYTGTYQGKDSKGNEVTKGMYEKGSRFYGYTPTQALAAILIHEVAHATGDFPPESGANVISESIINTNTVLTACFPKSNK
ncbi:MAG: RHS domain-containing protein, partial [Acidobacteria bacterium]|nr:RHS domain-containing protein [Acidobacteriota bacterium]